MLQDGRVGISCGCYRTLVKACSCMFKLVCRHWYSILSQEASTWLKLKMLQHTWSAGRGMRLGYEYMKDTHLHQTHSAWVSDSSCFLWACSLV